MPKPANLISANLLVCERILYEQDKVLSIIRLADMIHVKPAPPGIPPDAMRVPIRMLFMAKFNAPDGTPVKVIFRSITPDGIEKQLAISDSTLQADSGIPDFIPRGMNITLDIALKPAVFGVYYYAAEIDGEEVARTSFTLLEDKGQPGEVVPLQSAS